MHFAMLQKAIQYNVNMALKAHSKVWDNFWQLKALKNNEKCFLFNLKGSFHSQDI